MVTTRYHTIPTDLISYQKKPEVNEIHEKLQRISVTGLNSKEQEGKKIELVGKGQWKDDPVQKADFDILQPPEIIPTEITPHEKVTLCPVPQEKVLLQLGNS